jgi:cell division protein FtsW
MARKLKSDRVLFLTTILLVGISIVMVYSASAVVGLDRYGRPSLFLIKQAMMAVIGLAILAVVMRIDYRTYREPVFIWTSLAIVVAALIAVLFSPPVNNARRWFNIAGVGVQPSELAKLAAIPSGALLSASCAINEVGYALAPIGLMVASLFGLIMLEPDFGTSMSLVASFLSWYGPDSLPLLVGASLAALRVSAVMGAGYRRRILAFLNPWKTRSATASGSSSIAVGTGASGATA